MKISGMISYFENRLEMTNNVPYCSFIFLYRAPWMLPYLWSCWMMESLKRRRNTGSFWQTSELKVKCSNILVTKKSRPYTDTSLKPQSKGKPRVQCQFLAALSRWYNSRRNTLLVTRILLRAAGNNFRNVVSQHSSASQTLCIVVWCS